jgi:hypothetical protein
MHHTIAFHAKMMDDIVYFDQAFQQPDAGEFVKALVKSQWSHRQHMMETSQALRNPKGC